MRAQQFKRCFVPTMAASLAFGGAATQLRADNRPAVKVTMSPIVEFAERGRVFSGEFQILSSEPGVIENVSVRAIGWQLVNLDVSAIGAATAGASLVIPFQMIPGDPNQLVTVRFTYNGKSISKSFHVGPAAFARRGRDYPAVLAEPGQPEEPRTTAGGAITLRFKGRLIYDRPVMLTVDNMPTGGTIPVGVDTIWVEVIDEDDISTETIWSGYTDVNGYFDTGNIQWDDCDAVGCDDPDIYLRWECDTPIVNVQDANDILEEDWSWSTEANTYDDFTGSFIDFGTLKPADGGQMPILHIHNSITRAHRWIKNQSGTGISTNHVDVQWPEDEAGSGAYHDGFYDEIYISPSRQWHEDTHTHEFGHHFLDEYAANVGDDYCNGICDDDDDCGHCMWCQETVLDAYNEGWPNWLADIVTRDYPASYSFSDGSPYTPLKTRSQETIQTCQEDDTFHDAFKTEGFVGAVLRDIEDSDPDPQPVTVGEYNVIERRDCIAMGPDEVFYIATAFKPTTLSGFLFFFMAQYPDTLPRLYGTLRNISDDYAGLFPPDTEPPGVVQAVTSSSHPIGEGGALPCIVLDWDTPPDDVTGGRSYSINWSTDPAGKQPDEVVEIVGSCVTVTMGPEQLGDHYISLRARDWAGRWSNGWGVFGPFTVTDCNANGLVDVCEISCNWTGDACFVGAWCEGQFECGFAEDCNENLRPDDCDVASGASSDCNENGVPDECENISHWDLKPGLWSNSESWREKVLPAPGNDICIGVFPGQIISTLDTGSYQVGILMCDEDLTISTLSNPAAQLILGEPSRIRGNLTLANNGTVLRPNDRLDVDGLVTWTGSNVTSSARFAGTGESWLHGGMVITGGVVHIDSHDLFLEGNNLVQSNGRIDYLGDANITIRPGATFDYQSTNFGITGGFTGSFVNLGTFTKTVSPATMHISVLTQNNGLMHVSAGTFQLTRQSNNSGAFIGDPGTILEFVGGGHEFLPSSSIVAETVRFPSGIAGSNNVRGTYNVSASTVVTTATTFTNEATVVSYGQNFTSTGSATLNTVLGHPIVFQAINGGNIAFDSGDPVVTETLTLQGFGTIQGSSNVTVNGVLTWGAGTNFRGPSVLNANGPLNVGSGGSQKSLIDRTLNIAAAATLNGSFGLTGSSAVNVLSSGSMDIRIDGTAISSETPPLSNAGTIIKSAGAGSTTISPTSTNSGRIEVRTGLLQFRRLTQTAGEVFLNGGNFGMTQVSTPQPFHLQGGTLRGNGTVIGVVNHTGGIVSPGDSTGGLTVNGTYSQSAGGTLSIEISGMTPFTEYDQLNVTGTATLDGTLLVQFINPSSLMAGDSFTIVTAGNRIGIFSNRIYTGLPSHLDAVVSATPTAFILDIVVRSAPDGDCNASEFTDVADHVVLSSCMSGPLDAPAPIAPVCRCIDMDLDDDVDLQDHALFQNLISP